MGISLRAGVALVLIGLSTTATAQPAQCDSRVLRDVANTARDNIITATDGAAAIAAWRSVIASGGAVAWAVTEYNVDARSTFVFAFDRHALRVYRAGAFGPTMDTAMDGCLPAAAEPEAVIPWTSIREIESGNWVLWFKLAEPVSISSDRGGRRSVRELKAYFHGAPAGDLTYHYNADYVGHIPFWNVSLYEIRNLRGIAVGPNDFQRRLQFVIASVVDSQQRIALKRKGRGAGW
jgi:hypothetical protein